MKSNINLTMVRLRVNFKKKNILEKSDRSPLTNKVAILLNCLEDEFLSDHQREMYLFLF